MAKEKKFLDTNVFTYAIDALGKKINEVFLKKSDEITEVKIDEIFTSVFDKNNNSNNGGN